MSLPGNEHLISFDPIHFSSKRDGYSFTGRYVETLEGVTKFGDAPVHAFDDDSPKVRILWGFHADLKRAWREASPNPGDLVTITRSEKVVPLGDGKAQYEYTVSVERAVSEAPAEKPSAQTDEIPF